MRAKEGQRKRPHARGGRDFSNESEQGFLEDETRRKGKSERRGERE